MTDYTIRLATLADAAQISEHHCRMFADMEHYTTDQINAMTPVFANWVQQQLEQNTYIGWFAELPTGEIIGGAGLWLMDYIPNPNLPYGEGAHIVDVYIYPAYRRQGIARHLMTEVLQWCRDNNYLRVTLNASEAGRPLYTSMGFHLTNRMAILLTRDE